MGASITILYPVPTDVEKFASDYQEHLKIYAENLPDAPTPVVTNIKSHPSNPAPYHIIVTIQFGAMDDLKAVLASEGMKVVGGHANEISTGGAPVILIGTVD